jgi:hypothetical protein
MDILLLNDTGPLVTLLQQRLQRAGYNVVITDHYGEPTVKAVIQLQRDCGLVIDGIAGSKTQAALLKKDTSHLLSHDQLLMAATALGVDMASVFSVKAIESRGDGFLSDGRPVILYERHVMLKRMKANGLTPTVISMALLRYPTLINKRPGAYKGGAAEHYRLKLAASIHRSSALESCSWGLFQIMGYHWEALGYSSVEDFVEQMHASEGAQLDAFVRFIKNDSALHTALKQQNWAEFARRYNGPGYRKNQYDTRLADAYNNYQPWEAIA